MIAICYIILQEPFSRIIVATKRSKYLPLYSQQYIPDIATNSEGGSTIVVVSLVIEIEGDNTM
jgi:hypothetical protein